MSDDEDASSVSSCDSEEFGSVARGGFTRMYLLSFAPTSCVVQESNRESKEEGRETRSTTGGTPHYQLVYLNGSACSHGQVTMPHCAMDDDDESDELDQTTPSTTKKLFCLDDVPQLIRHFHSQKDTALQPIATDRLRGEVRSVMYHMEEVAGFLVEELAKPKILSRIEQGAKHLQTWIQDARGENPTFFELQTHPQANQELQDARIQLIVMKTVVRDVLVDTIFFGDSYYISLRDNQHELVLEETFVPDVASFGPCILVRNYKGAELKKLLLWCRLCDVPKQTALDVLNAQAASASSPSHKLRAQNPQLYVLLKAENNNSRQTSSEGSGAEASKMNPQPPVPQDFFVQMTQSQRFGMIEPGSLASREARKAARACRLGGLGMQGYFLDDTLRIMHEEAMQLPMLNTTQRDKRVLLAKRTAQFFETSLVPKLVDMLLETSEWLVQVRSSDALETLLLHRWLEQQEQAEQETRNQESKDAKPSANAANSNADKDEEFLLELELKPESDELGSASRRVPDPDHDQEDEDEQEFWREADLIVWKGIVHSAQLMVVYYQRRFFLGLRELRSSEMAIFDAKVPMIFKNKSNGFLLHQFAHKCKPKWLAQARLTYWQNFEFQEPSQNDQTSEKRAKRERNKQKQQQNRPKQDQKATVTNTSSEVKQQTKEFKQTAVRRVETTNPPVVSEAKSPQRTLKCNDDDLPTSKEVANASSSLARPKEKMVVRHHHIAPLNVSRLLEATGGVSKR